MSEAVNKIDNGSNQNNNNNTVNGMGSSVSGLSNSNEMFSNNNKLGPHTPYTPGMPATPHTPGSSSGVGISKLACSPSQYPNNNLSGGGMNSNAQHQQQQYSTDNNLNSTSCHLNNQFMDSGLGTNSKSPYQNNQQGQIMNEGDNNGGSNNSNQ